MTFNGPIVNIACSYDTCRSIHIMFPTNSVLDAYSIFSAGDELAFLLDFDGTLAEINPNPVLTRMNAETERIVHRIIQNPNIYVAIISGRRVADVRERVGIDNITYSGNHGMEIVFSNQTVYHYPISPEIYRNCSRLREVLQRTVAKHGAWVEDKNVSLTYHYRPVPEEYREQYLVQARTLISEYGYDPVQAHYAIEIKPPVVWSKGKHNGRHNCGCARGSEFNSIFANLYALGAAAKLILEEVFGDAWPTKKIKVVFAGDDNSDEDVMRVSRLFWIRNLCSFLLK